MELDKRYLELEEKHQNELNNYIEKYKKKKEKLKAKK